MKNVLKTIKEILNAKSNSDVPINNLLIAETITRNAKLFADQFNNLF